MRISISKSETRPWFSVIKGWGAISRLGVEEFQYLSVLFMWKEWSGRLTDGSTVMWTLCRSAVVKRELNRQEPPITGRSTVLSSSMVTNCW